MPGLKLALPMAFSDATLPVLQEDAVLPSTGALLLMEPAHPSAPVASVANGTTLPNIALAQAQKMYPTGTPALLGGNIYYGAPFTAGGVGVVERSAKGGVHFMLGTSNDLTRAARIEVRDDILNYMNANQGHSYYVSAWGNVTRKSDPVVGSGVLWGKMGTTYQAGTMFTRPSGGAAGGEVAYPTDSRRVGARASGAVGAAASAPYITNPTDTGPVFWGLAVSSMNSAIPLGGANSLFNLSSPPPAGAGQNRGLSSIFYRAYIEDLTVSGRTYNQVDALDWAEYQKQVLNPGGRYYGDTFTAPSTLA